MLPQKQVLGSTPKRNTCRGQQTNKQTNKQKTKTPTCPAWQEECGSLYFGHIASLTVLTKLCPCPGWLMPGVP